MTSKTRREPPEWALREARRVQDEIMEAPTVGEGDACRFIALALDAARRRGIEEAARIADGFTCGACGMDGKASIAIRALVSKEPT